MQSELINIIHTAILRHNQSSIFSCIKFLTVSHDTCVQMLNYCKTPGEEEKLSDIIYLSARLFNDYNTKNINDIDTIDAIYQAKHDILDVFTEV